MKTPFTPEEFFNVFERYNAAVYPAQWLIILAGCACLILLHSRYGKRNLLTGSILGLLWIWIGIVYHFLFFSGINPAAKAFGILFILEGILIVIESFRAGRMEFRFDKSARAYIGYFLILFGLIIYPLINLALNIPAVRIISLGLPCPTTIFTLGFFLLTTNKFPKYLLIIPLLWAVIGLSAAVNFGVIQDYMLMVSAVLACFFLISRKK